MSKKWYGSISNRIEEGHNYNDDKLIHIGDDITMYLWSDSYCYYVTKVIDQKHIFVRKYHVCADHSKPGGMGHQDWLYFKTAKEMHEYLNNCHIKDLQGNDMQTDLDTIIEDEDTEWIFRYGSWREVSRFTKEQVEKNPDWMCHPKTDKERKLYDEGKEVVQYYNLSGKVSFGVRNYYYDWEF